MPYMKRGPENSHSCSTPREDCRKGDVWVCDDPDCLKVHKCTGWQTTIAGSGMASWPKWRRTFSWWYI